VGVLIGSRDAEAETGGVMRGGLGGFGVAVRCGGGVGAGGVRVGCGSTRLGRGDGWGSGAGAEWVG